MRRHITNEKNWKILELNVKALDVDFYMVRLMVLTLVRVKVKIDMKRSGLSIIGGKVRVGESSNLSFLKHARHVAEKDWILEERIRELKN